MYLMMLTQRIRSFILSRTRLARVIAVYWKLVSDIRSLYTKLKMKIIAALYYDR